MTRVSNKLVATALAAVTGVGALFVSDNARLTAPSSLLSQAHAIIGRPLTPLSYAGVARRTTRRAVYATGVAAGAAAAAPVVVAPACIQAVDAYGRVYMRCP